MKTSSPQTICAVCVMDHTADPILFLGPNGCSYCESARRRLATVRETPSSDIDSILGGIRQRGRSGEYDCVVGVSGGVDSSWLLQWAVNNKLRVLAVHMDNCWNTSQASINIANLVTKLGCDLYTLVLPWPDEKAAKLSLMSADVVDIELFYDNALHKVCFDVAKKFGVKTILGGQTNASEGVELPPNWAWRKFDGRNLKNILRVGGTKTDSLPILTSLSWLQYLYINKIRWINVLDSLPEFGKDVALELLVRDYGFVPYGYKHYENVFTRYYQGEILPKKFGIDKRRAHLSSQIVAGEITRDQALDVLESSTYPVPSMLLLDREMVISKLGLSTDELSAYLSRPGRSHSDFKTDWFLANVVPFLLKLRRFFASFVIGKKV